MSKKAKWYWGGTTVGALVAVVLFITANDAWDRPDIVETLLEGWFLLWVLIHLVVVLGWMTIHLFDGNDDDHHHTGGSSSSGVEWGRLANWYMRGRLRNQMRRASRW